MWVGPRGLAAYVYGPVTKHRRACRRRWPQQGGALETQGSTSGHSGASYVGWIGRRQLQTQHSHRYMRCREHMHACNGTAFVWNAWPGPCTRSWWYDSTAWDHLSVQRRGPRSERDGIAPSTKRPPFRLSRSSRLCHILASLAITFV